MTSLVEKALRIAVAAHKKQTRKGDDTPYIVHPVVCALMLAGSGAPEEVIAAALVHDVLEDTDFPKDELRQELGEEVYGIVATVSENKSLPWKERKEKYMEAVRAGSQEAKLVSVADKVHNAQSFLAGYAEQGSNIWDLFYGGREERLWFEEEMLKVFEETLKHPLVDEYRRLVAQIRELDD